jgi:hypothetical protein
MTDDEASALANELEKTLEDHEAANAARHFRDVSKGVAQKVIEECLRRNLERLNQAVSSLQPSVLAPGLDVSRFQTRDDELRALWKGLP